MSDHRELYQRRPDLRRYNALERYKGLRHAVGKSHELDLSRAYALRDAIIEFDPAVHELPTASRFQERAEEGINAGDDGRREGIPARARAGEVHSSSESRPVNGHSVLHERIPVDDDGNVYATSFRPTSREMASLVDVSEAVEPGDVLVIDRDNPGLMRRGLEASDTGVIGVVAADAGVVLGTQSPEMGDDGEGPKPLHRAAVALAGVVNCKVDATYGAVWPGDLLVTSPTLGHAMRTDAPLPGTMLGKALDPLEEGTGTVRVLVMLR
jgi:hypothetical protein